ncbi:GL27253 [Drosophila persimilis]|uniref:GL27253 n=1 Tax=Drosophila persimilis TaxID=7234 RepID=B4GYU5_DROPE|nr:GL27253 [Drosophila persimilis]
MAAAEFCLCLGLGLDLCFGGSNGRCRGEHHRAPGAESQKAPRRQLHHKDIENVGDDSIGKLETTATHWSCSGSGMDEGWSGDSGARHGSSRKWANTHAPCTIHQTQDRSKWLRHELLHFLLLNAVLKPINWLPTQPPTTNHSTNSHRLIIPCSPCIPGRCACN